MRDTLCLWKSAAPVRRGIMAGKEEGRGSQFFRRLRRRRRHFPETASAFRPSVGCGAGRGRRVRVEGHLTLLPRLKRRFSLYHFVLLRTNDVRRRGFIIIAIFASSSASPANTAKNQVKCRRASVGERLTFFFATC